MFGSIGSPELLFIAVIVATIWWVFRGPARTTSTRAVAVGAAPARPVAGSLYCQHCGATGRPVTRVKGSFLIELILWFCFLVPGVIYSVWRMTTKERVCPKCGTPNMIPLDSPKARAALASPNVAPVTTHVAPVPARTTDPLDGPPAPWRTRQDPHQGPHGFVAVVGESNYQDTLRGLSVLFDTIGRDERTFTATLTPEPTNPHDPRAVAVTTENGTPIGYLAREMAATFQPRLLRHAAVVRCPAQLRGGADGQSIGVVLDFDDLHV